MTNKTGMNKAGTNTAWPAPAKLNLMLHITGRRDDGYHELQTVFQFIDFADELVFKIRSDTQIIRHCENFEIPAEQDIIVRAAHLLRQCFAQEKLASTAAINTSATDADLAKGVDIYLTKNIPMGAGLGGGSSDAATTLIALNQLWKMAFSIETLAEMGLTLGADVPVFVRGFAAFAEGVGEKLTPIYPPEKWYLVLLPPVHVSTKEVFENSDLTRDCSTIKLCDLSRHEWRNVCTEVVCKNYPEVSQAIEIVGEYSKARMSGTGAAVFADFETEAQVKDILQKIRQNQTSSDWFSFIAKGLNRSPLHDVLDF